MSVFTPAEISYLQGQRLGRLATIGHDGHPHVVPVSFRYNPDQDTIDIGGHGFATRKKFRDVQRDGRVAFVVDDLASITPWRARGIEIRGRADVLSEGGKSIQAGFDPEMFRVHPRRVISWGIDGEAVQANARTVGAVQDPGHHRTLQDDRAELGGEPATAEPPTIMPAPLGGAPVPAPIPEDRSAD